MEDADLYCMRKFSGLRFGCSRDIVFEVVFPC